MSEGTLVLDIETQLRGPLAECLCKIAGEKGKRPIDCLADIVEGALMQGVPEPADQRRIDALCKELHDLRRRYQKALAEPFEFPPKTRAKLAVVAKARALDIEGLVLLLAQTIADDDLFAAVLDK
jgi:hypothetical protein